MVTSFSAFEPVVYKLPFLLGIYCWFFVFMVTMTMLMLLMTTMVMMMMMTTTMMILPQQAHQPSKLPLDVFALRHTLHQAVLCALRAIAKASSNSPQHTTGLLCVCVCGDLLQALSLWPIRVSEDRGCLITGDRVSQREVDVVVVVVVVVVVALRAG